MNSFKNRELGIKPISEDPAEPITITEVDEMGRAHNVIYPGLSIRATIAMHVAAGLTASDTEAQLDNRDIARRSVHIADALISELQK